jgi:hypothetical protein
MKYLGRRCRSKDGLVGRGGGYCVGTVEAAVAWAGVVMMHAGVLSRESLSRRHRIHPLDLRTWLKCLRRL